jgi:alginate O-acetyltransferase complex protein AlgI
MVLSSSAYFIFLIGVFFLYWPVARFRALGLATILLANYFFYAKWDLFYLFLIPAASTCDFAIGLGLERSKSPRIRRLLVSLSVLLNLGILASFKYMPFFLDNYARLSGKTAPGWHWIFPLGISFYAFQSLTYTIDIYRRDAKATQSYLAYLTSVSFFPTTLAGPITRVATLLPQFEKRDKVLSPADGGRALFLIALGLTKKLLIADYLADNLVNRVFDFPKLYSGAETLIATYGYALQLYYDFSGYTDIAIGSALLLGIKLPANFNMPYAAESIADFWRRWHISLSNWLRDYLYFSLPGLRSKWKIFTYLNLIVTMLLGGLWHGASWNFVIWGLLHGIGLAAARAFQGKTGDGGGWTRFLRIFLTVNFVCFAWIFFRSPTLEAARNVLSRIASLTVSFENISPGVTFVLLIALVGHYFPMKWQGWVADRFVATPFYAQAAALMLLAIALQYVAATGVAPFIYTKF